MKVKITYNESDDFGRLVGSLKPDNREFSDFNFLLRQSIESFWFEKHREANGIGDDRMYQEEYPMIIVFLDKSYGGQETDFQSAKDWYYTSVKEASSKVKKGAVTFAEFKKTLYENERMLNSEKPRPVLKKAKPVVSQQGDVEKQNRQKMRYVVKAADGTYLYSGDVFFEYTDDVFKARNFKTEKTARKRVADIEKRYGDSLLDDKKTPLTVVGIEIVEKLLS